MSTVSVLRSVCDNDEQFDQTSSAEGLYTALLQEAGNAAQHQQGASFLRTQLERAAALDCDLPPDMQQLEAWVDQHCTQVGEDYAAYLKQRREGAPRQYFASRSAALHYLQAIAPTKLVDGAWLYGLLRYWPDARFRPLITTYLEELGDGDAEQNHVLLYEELLEKHGCSSGLSDDSLYTQGAIQLALGHNCDEFLPEVIGYNLGYEQPPLHMLITAYELKELGIDPYYFTLHVTTDNASTGHARQAAQAVQRLAPTGDADAFYQRVCAGYMLNDIGPDATSIRASFNTYQQTLRMLGAKSFYGRNMHSDYCRIEGKTVNEWLQTPGQIETFLQALIKHGWVKPNQDPQQSRFWQLIAGPRAKMSGVFNAFEMQLIYDWIAGSWLQSGAGKRNAAKASAVKRPSHADRFNDAPGQLQKDLQGLQLQDKMAHLVMLMSPGGHTSPAGLEATRMFSAIYRS